MTLTKNQKMAFWAILVLQFLLLLAFVFFRLIDFDEGLFLYYAQLVKEGNLPYVDFFYPQMPYLPLAYALVADSGFDSLFMGRLVSALLGLASAVILFFFIRKLTSDFKSSLIVFFLYSLNGLIVNWHSVVKTLVFSDFFALLSFCCFAFYLLSASRTGKLLAFLSGFFVSLAIGFRLVLFPLFLVEAILLLVMSKGNVLQEKLKHLLLLILGTMFGSCLTIYLLLKDPSSFVFGNLGYHLIWGNQVIQMTLLRRLFTLAKFVFYPQNLMILILAFLGALSLLRRMKKGKLAPQDRVTVAAVACSAALIPTFFLMSPTQFQYYEQVLPFLLLTSLPILPLLAEKMEQRKYLTFTASIGYLLLVIPFVMIFIFGIRQRDKPVEIKTVQEVVQAIRENSRPQEAIFTAWPGYAVLSRRNVKPGLEAWGGGVIPFLSPQQITRFKLIDDSRVEQTIAQKQVGLIVKEEWFPAHIAALIEENYRLVKSTPFADVYVVKNEK
jgi:hypothetical protein